jgi:hypothetical protein
MTVSPYFSYYLAHYLTVEGVNAMIEHRKEVEHHVQHKLLYSEMAEESSLFDLDSEMKLAALQNLIGEMAVVGMRWKRP